MSVKQFVLATSAAGGGVGVGAALGVQSATDRKKLERKLKELKKMDNSDPFGIEKGLKIPGMGDRVRRGVHGATGAAKEAGERVRTKRATNPVTGQKIGRGERRSPEAVAAGINQAAYGLLGGSVAGTVVGNAAANRRHPVSKASAFKVTEMGTAAGRAGKARWPGLKPLAGGVAAGTAIGGAGSYKARKNENQYINARKKKALSKALNATKEERHKALVWNADHTKKGPYNKQERKIAANIQGREQLRGQAKGAGVGLGVGAAAGAVAGAATRSAGALKSRTAAGALVGGAAGAVVGQQRGDYVGRVKGQRKYKEALGKSMSESAFGVDHGDFSKARQKEASTGRKVTGTLFPGYHGAIAGKPGKKLKAVGVEAGHSLGGYAAGGAAGAAVGGALGAAAGGKTGAKIGAFAGGSNAASVGSLVGGYKGTKKAQARGYYKKQN